MARIFLRSTDGNDGNAGTDKSAPKATLASALTAAGAGGSVEVSSSHAETQSGAMTLTSSGTMASPATVVCVPDWGAGSGTASVGSKTTGATVTVSGSNEIQFRGVAYSDGVKYIDARVGNAFIIGATAGGAWAFDNTTLEASGGSGNPLVIVGNNAALGAMVLWRNTTLKFGTTGAKIRARARLHWLGGSVDAGGSVPTNLFDLIGDADAGVVLVEGVDLSALGSGKSLVLLAATDSGDITFLNCKLGSSVAVISGTIGAPGGPRVRLINCDSADTQYRFAQYVCEGAETSETTIVRASGAVVWGTPMAQKIVTTANCSSAFPYQSLPVMFPVDVVGSAISVSIPVITDGVTLTNAEAWVEVEYLGTSGFPLGLFASDRVSDPIFGTPANQTTDSASSWTTTGLSSPVKQTLDVTFTPQEKGLVRVRVMVAKASTTVYYDPRVLDPSNRQYQSVSGFVNEAAPVLIVED